MCSYSEEPLQLHSWKLQKSIRGKLFLYLGTSAHVWLPSVISSAAHGKAGLNLVLCGGSRASVNTTSEKASGSTDYLLRLHLP